MALYTIDTNSRWNLENILFLYPPDNFVGSFTNEKMQARHKAMQDEKVNKILSTLECTDNPLEAMNTLNRLDHLQFLQNNLEKFKQASCLEEAVLLLYFHKNGPFTPTDTYQIWEFLLGQCDKKRLLGLGSPFPSTTMTGYRGSVTGTPKGLSWTVSKDKADWFLDRWKDKEMGGGTIFSLEISSKDILYYIEDEKRQEVILFPKVMETADIKKVKEM